MSDQNNPRKGKKIVIPGSAPAAAPAAPVEGGAPGTAQQQSILQEIAKVQQQQAGAMPQQGQQFEIGRAHV